MQSETTISCATCFVCLLMGIILLSVYVGKYEEDEDAHNDKYTSTNALITDIEANPYDCYQEQDCSKCVRGYGTPACSQLMSQNQTGSCHSGKSLCCREECQSCDYISYPCGTTKNSRGNTETKYCKREECYYCGERSWNCNENCKCEDRNHMPLCESVKGLCHDPKIFLEYSTKEGKFIKTYIGKHCGFNDKSCLNNFIDGHHVGHNEEIHYEKSHPSQAYFNGAKPKYKPKGNVVTAIVFGTIFALVGVCVLVAFCDLASQDNECHEIYDQCCRGLGKICSCDCFVDNVATSLYDTNQHNNSDDSRTGHLEYDTTDLNLNPVKKPIERPPEYSAPENQLPLPYYQPTNGDRASNPDFTFPANGSQQMGTANPDFAFLVNGGQQMYQPQEAYPPQKPELYPPLKSGESLA